MNIVPVGIRRLLSPLTRPMAMKAPRQDASAAPSSERAEAAPASCNREGAGFIQKACYLQPLLHPRAALSYTKAQGNVGSDRLAGNSSLSGSRLGGTSRVPRSGPPSRARDRSREM